MPDWQTILRSAYQHGMSSLLYENFKDSDIFPESIIRQLKTSTQQCWANNHKLLEAYQHIACTMHQHAIPVIPLKGIHLIQHYYPDMALRPMADIDILVPDTYLGAAQEVLGKLGYQDTHPQQRSWYRKYHMHYGFVRAGQHPVYCELHWQLCPPKRFNPDMDAIWQRSQVSQHDASMELHDLILHLIMHRAQDGRLWRLIHLVDLALILDKEQHRIDWQLLHSRARSNQQHQALRHTIQQLHDLDALSLQWPHWPAHKPGVIDRLYQLRDFDGLSTRLRYLAHYARSKFG